MSNTLITQNGNASLEKYQLLNLCVMSLRCFFITSIVIRGQSYRKKMVCTKKKDKLTQCCAYFNQNLSNSTLFGKI